MYVSRHTYCSLAVWGSGISPNTLSRTVNKLESVHPGCEVLKISVGQRGHIKRRNLCVSHKALLKKVWWLEEQLEKHTVRKTSRCFKLIIQIISNLSADESIHFETIVAAVDSSNKTGIASSSNLACLHRNDGNFAANYALNTAAWGGNDPKDIKNISHSLTCINIDLRLPAFFIFNDHIKDSRSFKLASPSEKSHSWMSTAPWSATVTAQISSNGK